MKKLVLLIYIFLGTSIFAQNVNIQDVTYPKLEKPFKIDARQFLVEHDEIVSKFHEENPNFERERRLNKVAWNFSIGSQKNWFAYNFENSNFYTVSSTCRAVGTNCYIFVENDLWNSEVTQTNVNAIQNGFDSSTPANSTKGIYSTVVDNFGSPPDIDGDPKIIILILDIKDGFDGSGGYIGGYFHSINQINTSNSNLAEIYYLDANPSDLSTESGLNDVLSTTAHEFQHMVDYNYHKSSQLTFLNEGCSLVSEVICGYPIYNQTYFNNEYNHYLFDWRTGDQVLSDYSRAAKYMTYMYGQFGKNFLINLVQSNKIGIAGINDALSNLQPSTSLRFTDALSNWLKANIINNDNYPQWNYTIPNIYSVTPTDHKNPNFTSANISVAQAAADYIMFSEGQNLQINFNDYSTGILDFISVKIKDNNIISIENILPNTNLQYDNFGIDFDKIIFGILNTDANNSHSYKYSSIGDANIIELAYDENPPTGYLSLSVNDTVCVFFDAVPSGFLESIKVGLVGSGTVRGAIYRFTGNQRPTPLGKKLLDISAVSNYQPSNISTWSNWVTIDLSSQNISTDNAIAVAFIVEGNYPNYNQVMVTSQPQDNIHSYTYLNDYSSGTPADWFYINSSETDAYAYLIRANVGFGITGIEDQAGDSQPFSIRLEQNYPNPFNPLTTIKYSIPTTGTSTEFSQSQQISSVNSLLLNDEFYVSLVVYDILGKKVKTLVNEVKQPGNYSVNFDAADFSSGTYFYVLRIGDFLETKKMILLK